MRGRNWRKDKPENTIPSNIEVLNQFDGLLQSIEEIISGASLQPSSLHFWFYKNLSYKVFSQTRTWSAYTLTLLRERIDNIPNLSQEDIRQQLNLYLLEIHSFYKQKYSINKKVKLKLYDFIRFNLVKYISNWIAHQILLNTGDILAPVFSDEYFLDEEELFTPSLDLGWILLKSNEGVLGSLTIRQKYLIYLRYNKGLTILEISDLINRHRALIEKDFSDINLVLNIKGHYVKKKLS